MNAQERQPLEKSGEVLSSEPQNPDDDHDQSVKTETAKKKGVPQSTVLGRLPPPSDSHDVVCPPRWRPTHLRCVYRCGVATSICSPSYVPCPLPLQLRDSLSYVGNSSASIDHRISDMIT
ncbi:jg3670 [Pararge aegeria aegeria]|uniref:Jg3670 protein n=1 Tax=Pararge aegeria aegeria TaxID=348720 RepID=A0A8S4S3W4_9NEOP|nr:jg3670 [Pararge aegeria aegeria]